MRIAQLQNFFTLHLSTQDSEFIGIQNIVFIFLFQETDLVLNT